MRDYKPVDITQIVFVDQIVGQNWSVAETLNSRVHVTSVAHVFESSQTSTLKNRIRSFLHRNFQLTHFLGVSHYTAPHSVVMSDLRSRLHRLWRPNNI